MHVSLGGEASSSLLLYSQKNMLPREQGSQLVDTVQRKPGRGNTTLSVSCSDKIARWSFIGIQGLSCHI